MDVDPGNDQAGSHRPGIRDDDESSDAATPALDVTPRQAASTPSQAVRSKRAYVAVGGVALLLGILGLVLFNGLNSAAVFYKNVDEAAAQREALGDKRFRMQGNVVDGTIQKTDGGVSFVIAYGDARLDVVNSGAPPELFDAKIPVILEGEFVGNEFHSDQILIRHDSTYDEKNADRINKAEADAQKRAGASG
ncbi:MAG: cytochrome c maturation protein CcmE [Microthrixaceae bacterium]